MKTTTRKVVEYLEEDGASPFAKWFARIDPLAATKVTTALYRMEQGNLSNVKGVGQGVRNTASTMDQAIGSTSANKAMCSSSCLVAAVKKARTPTSNWPNNAGELTKRAARGEHNANHA